MNRRTAIIAIVALFLATSVVAQAPENRERGFAADKLYQFGGIDNVNLFNGNLILTIPLGQSYQVSSTLSYGLALTYNSTVWDYDKLCTPIEDPPLGGPDQQCLPYVLPNRVSNAGLGWYVSLGELLPANSRYQHPDGWTYVSPDGGRHQFDSSGLSKDGLMLRKRELPDNSVEIDSPDGVIRRFVPNADVYHLVEIRDAHSQGAPGAATTNYVHITYNTLINPVETGAETWDIRDSAGREQKLFFRSAPLDLVDYDRTLPPENGGHLAPPRNVLARVELTAFGGTTDVYTLDYDSANGVVGTTLTRDNDHDGEDLTQDNARVALLVRVNLPDGTSFRMTKDDGVTPDYEFGNQDETSGVLYSLTLPTLAKLSWLYERRDFPQKGDEVPIKPRDGGHDFRVDALGVKRKTVTDPISGTTSVWTYTAVPTPNPVPEFCPPSGHNNPYFPCQSRELIVTVTDPLGIRTENFFSTCLDFYHQAAGWEPREYGLPITHNDTSQPGRGLSTRVWKADGTAVQRSTYVSYEGRLPFEVGSFMRINGSRTVFNDDDDSADPCPNCYVDRASSDYDGFGHYRKVVTTTNFPSTDPNDPSARTVYTDYNGATPENGETQTSPQGTRNGNFAFQPTDPWIINTFTAVKTSVTTGSTETTEALSLYDFEPSTGFLRRLRTMLGDQPQKNDLLAVFQKDTLGNVQTESYYGGDAQDIDDQHYYPTQIVIPAAPAYRIAHTFQDGVLASSTYKSGTADYLRTLDLTIDGGTGFPSASRDASGLQTTFTYGPMGRLSNVQPPSGPNAPAAGTHYTYHNANGSTGAYADVDQPSDGSLAHGSFQFDGLGRVHRELTRMPDGDAIRETQYNANGWKTAVSERETNPTHFTHYLELDSLGRAHRVSPPDSTAGSHDTVIQYFGARKIRKTVQIAMAADAPESPSSTTETYDAYGRLRRVEEPSGSDGHVVSTFYRYDATDHLIEVSTTDGDVNQTRKFDYDHRGFLLGERHPEKGVNGNGWTYYKTDGTSGGFDARGHMLRRREDGSTKYDQDFIYDPAERLIRVMEHSTQQPLKEFFFDTISDSGHNYQSPGHLLKSVRHNRSTALGDVTVSNYFQYDAAGRTSSKETAISPGPSFTQSFTYNALGAPDKLTYPSCQGCGSATLPQREISLGYTRGLLTSVDGFANSITYWPNGMMHQITHANGPIDTQEMDPTTGMARPLSISFTNVTSCSDITITTQPSGGTVDAGNGTLLSVTATAPQGFNPTYQWYIGTSGDTSHSIEGATSSTYATGPLSATTSYWVRVSSDSCHVDSNTAVMHVCVPMTVIEQPHSVSAAAPASGTIRLKATFVVTGDDVHIQWFKDGSQSAFSSGAEAGDDFDTVPATHRYQAVATDYCHHTVTSNEITLSTVTCIKILTQPNPSENIVFEGGVSFPLGILIQDETKTSQPYDFEYHWHHGMNGQDVSLYNKDLPNGGPWNKPNIIATPSGRYDAWWCVVTKTGCPDTTSDKAYVRVAGECPLPVLTLQPTVLNIDSNEHTFTASVDWPHVTYQWYRGATGDTHLPVTGQTSRTYTPSLAGMYWVRVTDDCGKNHEDSATLVAYTGACNPVIITGQPQSVDIAWGENPTLHVDATNATSYTWYELDKDGGTVRQVGDGTKNMTPPAAPRYSTAYQVSPQNSCNTALSLPAWIHIKRCTTITVTSQPASGMVLSTNNIPLTLQVVASSTGGPITYTWYEGETGDTREQIHTGTDSTLSVHPTATTSYWVRMETAECAIDSDTAVVTVCTPPAFVAPNLPVTADITYGQSYLLGVNTIGNDLHYVWHAGSATSELIVGTEPGVWVTPSDTTVYVAVITGACGDPIQTEPITVRVCRPPVIDQQPQSVNVFSGSPATLHVGASEVLNVPLQYLWQDLSGAPPANNTASTLTIPAVTSTKQYVVHVSAGACTVDSNVVTVGVCTLPQVINTGSTKNVAVGETVTLTCAVVPVNGNVYTWYAGPVGNFAQSAQVSYNSSPTYTFTATAQSGGTYWATVSREDDGCVSHTDAYTVNVCVPVITQQPADATYDFVHPVALSVTATSPASMSYQWYTGVRSDTTHPIGGATQATYSATPATATTYWCRITSCNGNAWIDSNAATVTPSCQSAQITTQPVGGSITQGQSLTITVYATGTNLSYQWYQGASGNTSNPVFGSTASITVNPINPIDYWVKVTAPCDGTVVNSTTAHVSVCTTPTVTTQPVGTNVFAGQTATLTVAASESTGEPLTYQWRAADGTLVGAGSSFTTPPITQQAQYFARIIAGACTVDSNTVTVGVCTLPQVITTGTTNNVAIGQTVTLSCIISPGTGNVYTWYAGPVGDFVNSAQVSYNSSNTFTFTASATSGGTYWATVSRSDDGCVSHTNAYTVNVCVPAITTQPAPSTMINSGQSTTLTVAANTSGLTYQWYVGTSGTTTTPISGGTGASVSVSPAVATNYWVKVTGSCGQSVNSNTAAVTICQPPAITTQPAANSYIVRSQNVTLSVAATGNGLTYQWYQGTTGNTSTPLASTTSTLTLAPINPIDYWVKVTGSCGSVNSNTAHVAVCTTPVIDTQPQGTSTFSGTSATLTVSASEATGETLHYQWYKNGSTAVGPDSATLNTGNLTADTTFFVRITAAGGTCTIDSNTVTVSMCPLSQTVTGAPNQNTTPAQLVRLQLPTMPGATSYKWYQGASGNTAAPLTVWQSQNYLDVNPTTTTSYWAQVQNGSCVSNTTTTTVTVCIPTITTQPQNVTTSSSATLSVVSNLSGSTYQWYAGTSGTTTNPIANATSASVTVSPASTTSYWCKVTGPCGTANSNTATVTICTPPSIQTLANASSVNRGYSSGLYSNATGTGLTYQWYIGNSGDTSQPISGATSSSYVIASAQNSEKYWVKVTGTCGSVNSTTAWISVNPVITQQPQQTITLTSGSRATLAIGASGTYLHYQWLYENGTAVSGAPDSPLFVSPDITAAVGYYCRVTSANGATDTYHSSVTLCTNDITQGGPVILNQGGNCRQIWANVGGTIDHIEWYQGTKGNTSIPIGVGNYVNVCPASSTNYWFRVYGASDCYTDSATLTAP